MIIREIRRSVPLIAAAIMIAIAAFNASDVSGYRTNLDTLHAEDINNMQVPLLVLIDLSKNYDEANNFVGFNNQSLYAASQVLFSVDGDTDGEKSIQLANCWNYTGDLFSYRNTSNN